MKRQNKVAYSTVNLIPRSNQRSNLRPPSQNQNLGTRDERGWTQMASMSKSPRLPLNVSVNTTTRRLKL